MRSRDVLHLALQSSTTWRLVLLIVVLLHLTRSAAAEPVVGLAVAGGLAAPQGGAAGGVMVSTAMDDGVELELSVLTDGNDSWRGGPALLLKWDRLRWVPYAGWGAAVLGQAQRFRLEGTGILGLDYLVDRTWAVGVRYRGGVIARASGPDVSHYGLARLRVVWGW